MMYSFFNLCSISILHFYVKWKLIKWGWIETIQLNLYFFQILPVYSFLLNPAVRSLHWCNQFNLQVLDLTTHKNIFFLLKIFFNFSPWDRTGQLCLIQLVALIHFFIQSKIFIKFEMHNVKMTCWIRRAPEL